jgi:hypothetical protein
MDQKAADQGWQQLQTHIEGFLGQSLRGDAQRIAYKPRFIAQLLEPPPDHNKSDHNKRNGGT